MKIINSVAKIFWGDGILIERTGGIRMRIFVFSKYMKVLFQR